MRERPPSKGVEMSYWPPEHRDHGFAKASPVATIMLSMPNSKNSLYLVRTVMRHVGAHTPLPITDLEDLCIAANEACILIMGSASEQGTVDCRFDELADGIEMEIRGTTDTARWASSGISADSVGWALLGALVDTLSWAADTTSIVIHLTKHASPRCAVDDL